MSHRARVILLCGLALTAIGVGAATADVLYLKDGSKIVGQVKQSGAVVRIDTDFGRHEIDASKIDHVEWGAPVGAVAPTGKGTAGRAAGTPARPEARKKDVALVLEEPVEVDFTDTPLPDVIAFFQSVKDVNFVLDRPRMPEDNAVSIKMKEVKLKTALAMILEPLGLGYEIRDNLVFISTRGRLQRYEVRVVDIRDILVNFSDRKSSSRNLDLASQTSDGDDSSSGDDDDDDDGASTEDMVSRARSLARLITETVRPETWDRNAARVLGGPTTSDEQTDSTSEKYSF